jgi:hypothetical protein
LYCAPQKPATEGRVAAGILPDRAGLCDTLSRMNSVLHLMKCRSGFSRDWRQSFPNEFGPTWRGLWERLQPRSEGEFANEFAPTSSVQHPNA